MYRHCPTGPFPSLCPRLPRHHLLLMSQTLFLHLNIASSFSPLGPSLRSLLGCLFLYRSGLSSNIAFLWPLSTKLPLLLTFYAITRFYFLHKPFHYLMLSFFFINIIIVYSPLLSLHLHTHQYGVLPESRETYLAWSLLCPHAWHKTHIHEIRTCSGENKKDSPKKVIDKKYAENGEGNEVRCQDFGALE